METQPLCLCTLTDCQAVTGLLVALGQRGQVPGTDFGQDLGTENTVKTRNPPPRRKRGNGAEQARRSPPPRWCAGRPAAGPVGKAERPPSAARGEAAGRTSGSNAGRPARTATAR